MGRLNSQEIRIWTNQRFFVPSFEEPVRRKPDYSVINLTSISRYNAQSSAKLNTPMYTKTGSASMTLRTFGVKDRRPPERARREAVLRNERNRSDRSTR